MTGAMIGTFGSIVTKPQSTFFQAGLVIHSMHKTLTGGTDNMSKQLLGMMWSIFARNAVDYEKIIRDDFLQ